MTTKSSRKGIGGRPRQYTDGDGNSPTPPPTGYIRTSLKSVPAKTLFNIYYTGKESIANPNLPCDDYKKYYSSQRPINPEYYASFHKDVLNSVRVRFASDRTAAGGFTNNNPSDSEEDSDYFEPDYFESPPPKKKATAKSAPRSTLKNSKATSKSPPPKSRSTDPPVPQEAFPTMLDGFEPLNCIETIIHQAPDYQCHLHSHAVPIGDNYCLLMLSLETGTSCHPKHLGGFRNEDNHKNWIVQGTMVAMADEAWVDNAFVKDGMVCSHYDEDGNEQFYEARFEEMDTMVTACKSYFNGLEADKRGPDRIKSIYTVCELPFNVNPTVKDIRSSRTGDILPGTFFIHYKGCKILCFHLEAEKKNKSLMNRGGFASHATKYGFELTPSGSGVHQGHHTGGMGGVGHQGRYNNNTGGHNVPFQGGNTGGMGGVGHQEGSYNNNTRSNAAASQCGNTGGMGGMGNQGSYNNNTGGQNSASQDGNTDGMEGVEYQGSHNNNMGGHNAAFQGGSGMGGVGHQGGYNNNTGRANTAAFQGGNTGGMGGVRHQGNYNNNNMGGMGTGMGPRVSANNMGMQDPPGNSRVWTPQHVHNGQYPGKKG